MAYTYGIKNTYRPSRLAPNAYGWSNRPAYNQADIPSALMDRPVDLTSEQFRQQFAYEWFQSGDLRGDRGLSNPPFVSGAAGRLHPLFRDQATGHPARILRGYIRRADFDAKDDVSRSRLYFMFNPEIITRDYVSYLEQTALDPFNSVYQSGNLVAPPSFMDFSFSLLFDRQEEATAADNPGVYVDYQFFDLVVRNVIPTDPNQSGNTLPDNGIMMVNPRDITVVFSPQLTVQGRPLNASVTFEKFTHRMTPTRMTIQLRMRAVYMGPVKDQVEYKKEEFQGEAAIPIDEVKNPFSGSGNSWFGNDSNAVDLANGNIGTGAALEAQKGLAQQFGQANDKNHAMRLAALQWAIDHVVQGGPGDGAWTDYEGANSGSKRWAIPESADCSGLITEAYNRIGLGETMKWQGHPGTGVMMQLAQQNTELQLFLPLSGFNWETGLLPGDVLIRQGHVGFFVGYQGTSGNCIIFDAAGPNAHPEVGQRSVQGHSSFTHLLRPTPHGHLSGAAQTSIWNTIIGTSGVLEEILIGIS